jgi:nitrite reductase/ring-hydroxylating ferredoxin subunit
MTFTVMHAIDPDSRLHGATEATLQGQNAELIVTGTGIDETMGQPVHVRTSYLPHEILWEHRFIDLFGWTEDGRRVIDYRRFHDTVPRPRGERGIAPALATLEVSMPQALQSPLKWPKEGNARVPYRVFADPEIYRTERDRVFLGPTWQYLALADELPEPGDYKTTFLGETPVIVTRGEDGQIHAMVNRCAHRGNLVCLKQRGHTTDGLTCVYHAWRYDLAGNLTSVAFRRGVGGKGGMPDSFQARGARAQTLRTDTFAGLVFGTLSPEPRRCPIISATTSAGADRRVMRGKPRSSARPRRSCTTTGSSTSRTSRTPTTPGLLHTFFRPSGSAG